ncbi:MAG: Glycosyl transferase family 2 [Candidatus Moranbacteria bacterium GW2011_GWC2_37_73]|nr:MAG: glycosyl transferase family protein [Parcubacteria group bacterium GW2011_GWC1_36_108]KKQ00235.1 MAG: Glycosyl transferase family 2 [Candidatus Moranbacteria bacterium GW2011_GWD1_36_198]KKQ01361.1 MAG: Glycosyl transferase family 2 [Candidatus Moranbacteria bacterium GW2011_GWD2_36_198]KKQ39258.1 MAG: Glycosyl transferase family 2 [Candidatus Moranbacteria bacterium GW2011_GWC2_37_73]HAR99611.1 glycosyltransferase family 2 protein [Candidatus Moranbacteria bacterium]
MAINSPVFPKVFVVILNFNGKNILLDCLTSVFKSDYSNLEIVVVDNNSTDESFEKARLNFSRSHFIKNDENIGFSKGNNVGIRYALEKFADYVFVLNNDTILEKTTISSLVKTAQENPLAGIISPLILNADNESVWFAGGKVQWRKMKSVHLTKKSSGNIYFSEYLSGCAMFIKKEVFKKVGLFDERFFLYYEDADFSLRSKKAGFDLLIDPTITIQHLEQSSSNDSKNYWLVLSGLLFFQTHSNAFWKVWHFFYLLLRKAKNFYNIYIKKDSAALRISQAYKDFRKLEI